MCQSNVSFVGRVGRLPFKIDLLWIIVNIHPSQWIDVSVDS